MAATSSKPSNAKMLQDLEIHVDRMSGILKKLRNGVELTADEVRFVNRSVLMVSTKPKSC